MPGSIHAAEIIMNLPVAPRPGAAVPERLRGKPPEPIDPPGPGPAALERLRGKLPEPLDSPRPGTSALERVRGKLSELLDPPGSASPGRPASPASPTSSTSLVSLIDSLRSAREHGRAVREAAAAGGAPLAPLETSVPALDELLAGGLPRGQLVEMIGARSSGRFSAVLAAIAGATTAGEAAALVDLGDGLDPQAAAALGVDLHRLLWLRPTTLKQALAGAEILMGSGFPMVALDLGNPPVRGGRGVEAGWLRLARAARAHGTALLVSSPYRVSGTAAAAVLQAARGRARWQGMSEGPPWLLDGLSCQVALEKCRGRMLPAGSLGLELRVVPAPTPSATPLADSPIHQDAPETPESLETLGIIGGNTLAAHPRNARPSRVPRRRVPAGEPHSRQTMEISQIPEIQATSEAIPQVIARAAGRRRSHQT
jgi:hypothetical protein